MEIKTSQALIRHLKSLPTAKRNVEIIHNHASRVKRQVFKGIKFSGISLAGRYSNCRFIDCEFDNVFGHFLDLKNCKFNNCKFASSRFTHFENIITDGSWDRIEFNDCAFANVRFDEGEFFNIFFNRCRFEMLNLGLEITFNVWFDDCKIWESFFSIDSQEESNLYEGGFNDIVFQQCVIDNSIFRQSDLRKSAFVNTSIYMSSFIDCQLSADTIVHYEEAKYPNYVSVDFQTILKSDNLDIEILKNYFNIHAPDVKKIASGIAEKTDFKTIFISYSFKDKEFANRINDSLLKNGLKTFLWEKDAPGGQLLEDIMENNIKKFDKVLFIASQNSIKSKACQFEISQARGKQEATWSSNTFFVIHIDNYLFEVEKNKIRPIKMAEEYWENIEELRRVNSKDFSKYITEVYDEKEFDGVMIDIVSELKEKP
jgi:uncharacterized protein YjbI with pentapeptide repeats